MAIPKNVCNELGTNHGESRKKTQKLYEVAESFGST